MELTLHELTKQFNHFTAVDRVSCTMENGVYGLLGVNGAGKTTLMRMLCTLITPTAGSITLDGQDIFQMGAQYRQMLGYLPQDFGYYPDFTAEDYLLYVKRRLGVAQAVLNDPAILILDEPTAGLDPNERIRFRNLISELAQDRLVLLSTHIVSDVEYIAGEIFLMKDGKIAHSGPTADLISAISDQVWLCTVPRREVDTFARVYKVANVRLDSAGAQLRILAPQPPTPDAVPAEVTLEDVFLSYFGETGGEMNDTV